MKSTRCVYLCSLVALALMASMPVVHAQTTVAGSVFGAFNQSTKGNSTQQSPDNSPGGLIELRQIYNPFIGYQAVYSIRRADQTYQPLVCPATGTAPACQPTLTVPGYAQELGADWVFSFKLLKIRPFALAGIGLQFNSPLSGLNDTHTSVKSVYDYGAGFDWALMSRIGIRAQYRGNISAAPDYSSAYISSGRLMHTAEPTVGVYFRF